MAKILGNRFSTGARKDHGTTSEKRVVVGLKGRLTPGSGAMVGAKSDGTTTLKGIEFRIEAKATIHQSISLKKSWLNKIGVEARETGRVPLLTLSFVDDTGELQDIDSEFIVMKMHTFKELTNK
jgi:hypothetical protein